MLRDGEPATLGEPVLAQQRQRRAFNAAGGSWLATLGMLYGPTKATQSLQCCGASRAFSKAFALAPTKATQSLQCCGMKSRVSVISTPLANKGNAEPSMLRVVCALFPRVSECVQQRQRRAFNAAGGVALRSHNPPFATNKGNAEPSMLRVRSNERSGSSRPPSKGNAEPIG